MSGSLCTSTIRRNFKWCPHCFEMRFNEECRNKNSAEGKGIESPSFKVTNVWISEEIFMSVIVCNVWGSGVANKLNCIVVHRVELFNGGVEVIVKIMWCKSKWSDSQKIYQQAVFWERCNAALHRNWIGWSDKEVLIQGPDECQGVHWGWRDSCYV